MGRHVRVSPFDNCSFVDSNGIWPFTGRRFGRFCLRGDVAPLRAPDAVASENRSLAVGAGGDAVALAGGSWPGPPAGQSKHHGRTVTCRDHVDLRVLSALSLADALCPSAVRMHLGAGAVEAEVGHSPTYHMQVQQRGKQPGEH